MTGNLSDQLISDPLRKIHENSKTGTLVVRHQTVSKDLIFEEGVCSDARSTDSNDDLGELLLRMGKLSPDQLDLAQKASPTPSAFPAALLEMKLFEPGELMDFRTLHAQEIIYGLFNWTSGSFEFKPGNGSPTSLPGLKLTLSNLIFEGVRRVTNPEVIHRGLKGTDRLIRLVPQFEMKASEIFLKPDEAFILSRIESSARILEVLQLSPLGLEMTQKTLYGFLSTGIIEFVPQAAEKAAPQTPAASRAYRSTSAPSYQPNVVENEPTPPQEDLEEVRLDVFLMLDKAKTKNYYDLLGVPTTGSPDEIKKSYYTLAKKYHPDRYHQASSAELKNALDTIFSTLSQAYDTLKVPATRASYDAKIFRLESSAASPDKPLSSTPTASGHGAPQQKLAELNYRQGRGHYDQQDYWGAVQAFRQSVRTEPDNPRYRYWLAMSLSKNAKWRREAEEHFLKAIELDQFIADHYVGLGLLYKEAGMQKRAENQFKQALQVSPDHASAHEALDALMGTDVKKAKGLAGLKGLLEKKNRAGL